MVELLGVHINKNGDNLPTGDIDRKQVEQKV
jgi:hypothetical protein